MTTTWRFFKISWLPFLFIALSACSTTEFTGPQAREIAMTGEDAGGYRVRPSDGIEIKFFSHPDLSDEVIVGPNGKVSLRTVDEILVAGLTTSQLDEVLTKEYLNHLKNVSLRVNVSKRSGQRVYVGGEVKKPGFYSLKDNMSVLDAILEAQGFKEKADPENVILLRKGQPKRRIAIPVNLKPVIAGEQIENDTYIMPYDIVCVNAIRRETFFTGGNKFVKEPRKKDVQAIPDESFLQDAEIPREDMQE